MDLLDFAKDPNLANDGVWHELDDTTRIKVARLNTPRFLEFVRDAVNEAGVNSEGELTEDDKERITLEAMANTVLLDWKGITVAGEELPYSVENALKILSAPQLYEFREKVCTIALNNENYRSVEVEEDLKKLLAS